jgi:hypothetical protein
MARGKDLEKNVAVSRKFTHHIGIGTQRRKKLDVRSNEETRTDQKGLLAGKQQPAAQ